MIRAAASCQTIPWYSYGWRFMNGPCASTLMKWLWSAVPCHMVHVVESIMIVTRLQYTPNRASQLSFRHLSMKILVHTCGMFLRNFTFTIQNLTFSLFPNTHNQHVCYFEISNDRVRYTHCPSNREKKLLMPTLIHTSRIQFDRHDNTSTYYCRLNLCYHQHVFIELIAAPRAHPASTSVSLQRTLFTSSRFKLPLRDEFELLLPRSKPDDNNEC